MGFSKHHSVIFYALGAAWLIALALGIARLHVYAATPGRPGVPTRVWPSGSTVAADPERANLVMLVHPRCPCSRASLAELEKIMTVCGTAVSANILFLEPRVPASEWKDTSLRQRAAQIPGVRSFSDPGGEEATRFGAMTSGHVLLYDRNRNLLFSGGITGARGHEGENAGSAAVIGLVAGKTSDRARANVFGCPLFGASDTPVLERVACRR